MANTAQEKNIDSYLKRFKDKNSHYIKIRLSTEEMNTLRLMMMKDEWNNTSGFIRYKLFGMNSHRRYKRELTGVVPVRCIEELLNSSMVTFHQDAVYTTLKYEKGISLIKKRMKEHKVSIKDFNRWVALLYVYYHDICEMYSRVLNLQYDLLKPFGVVISENLEHISWNSRKTYLRNVPDAILEFYASENWQNVDSEFYAEYGRRIKESLTKKFQ